MPYALGVDIGTTSAVAAVAHRRGTAWAPPDLVMLGAGSAAIPATLRLTGEGPVAGVDGAGPDIARGFLHRVGDNVSMSVGGRPYRAAELTAQLVDRIVGQVETALGEPPERLAVPVPAHWGEYRTGRLRAALARIALDPVSLPPAPVAVVEAHAAELTVAVGVTVAVYALGSTGCTCTLLRRDPDGYAVLASGTVPIGGADLDDVLIDRVRDGFTGRYPRVVWAALRQRCAAAREALSTEMSVTIRVPVSGSAPTVTVSCTEFEELILPGLTATTDLLRAVLRSGPAPVAVILAGGVTHTPLVRRLVESVASAPVLIAAAPEHTVASGATRIAGQPAAGQVTGQPFAGQPLAGQPLAGQPATGQPASEPAGEPAGLPSVYAAAYVDDEAAAPPYPPPRPPVLITQLTAPRRRVGR